MSPRVAHFVIAHKAPSQLLRLVRTLRADNHATVVHIDLKSTGGEWDRAIDELKDIGALLADRIVCSWGDYSSIAVTLNCIAKLRETGSSWDFVNQLSGQDYPIRPIAELNAHLSANQGKCLMDIYPFPFPGWRFGGYDRLPSRRFLPRRFREYPPLRHKPFGGSQWWCLPFAAIDHIDQLLRSETRYVDYWKRTAIPDEMVFHTILGNSGFSVPAGTNHLHYIKWSGGPNPNVLGPSDMDDIKASGQFFARKFDEEQYPGMLDLIDAELRRPRRSFAAGG